MCCAKISVERMTVWLEKKKKIHARTLVSHFRWNIDDYDDQELRNSVSEAEKR